MMFIYGFPNLVTDGAAWPKFERDVLDAAHAVGTKILMDVFEDPFVSIFKGENSTEAWSNFTRIINYVKNHPATLGYYLCDDCAGQVTVPEMQLAYTIIKGLDPYHVMTGAVNAGTATSYFDGESLNLQGAPTSLTLTPTIILTIIVTSKEPRRL